MGVNGKKIPDEILEKIRYEYEGGASFYSLQRKYDVSYNTLAKYKNEQGWKVNEYIPQMEKWKEMEAETKKSLGEAIIYLSHKVVEAAQNVDPLDTTAVVNVSRAVKSLGDMVGAKSTIDIEEQKARLKALRQQVANTDKTKEPIKIEIGVPEEWQR